jgi:hypothetical protein
MVKGSVVAVVCVTTAIGVRGRIAVGGAAVLALATPPTAFTLARRCALGACRAHRARSASGNATHYFRIRGRINGKLAGDQRCGGAFRRSTNVGARRTRYTLGATFTLLALISLVAASGALGLCSLWTLRPIRTLWPI